MLKELQEGENFSNVTELTNNSAKLNVLYFTASWCGPCKRIAPRVQELANENPDVNFYKIDVDVFEELTMSGGVNCMPTFLIYKNNSQVGILEGADGEALTNLIKNNI